uniref:DUF1758 domain-containing protein n=1 Tax=Steinernema glaseri TaxID=37863 RepID=A0A1I7YY73_9BILA
MRTNFNRLRMLQIRGVKLGRSDIINKESAPQFFRAELLPGQGKESRGLQDNILSKRDGARWTIDQIPNKTAFGNNYVRKILIACGFDAHIQLGDIEIITTVLVTRDSDCTFDFTIGTDAMRQLPSGSHVVGVDMKNELIHIGSTVLPMVDIRQSTTFSN